MIDEVHMLTNTAFNAMLKTLEEPPEYLKFVLATTDPQKVPVTVLSRCLQFNLRPMAPETVREHLGRVLHIEGVEADAVSLRLLARAARGSMRDALSLTDQAIAFGGGQLQETSLRQMLGSVDRSYVFRLIAALAGGDGQTVVETSEQLRLNGLSAASTLEEMTMVLQRMAVLQAVPAAAADESDPDDADMRRLANLMPPDETQLLYSIGLHGRAELGLAPDDYAALTMVLLRLLAFKPAGFVATAEKKTLNEPLAPLKPVPVAARDAVQASVVGPAAPPTPPAPAPAPPPVVAPVVQVVPATAPLSMSRGGAPSSDHVAAEKAQTPQLAEVPVPEQWSEQAGVMTDVAVDVPAAVEAAPSLVTPDGDFWYATVQQLVAAEAVTALARELALQSQLVQRDADHWQLQVERESLTQPGSRDRLQAGLASIGHAVRVSVSVGAITDSPARRNAAQAEAKQRAAEKIILDDPFVQSMMQEFGAKIVPGSIRPLD
jgi:DNA polymerase-3 subunit gamma/tau